MRMSGTVGEPNGRTAWRNEFRNVDPPSHFHGRRFLRPHPTLKFRFGLVGAGLPGLSPWNLMCRSR